MKRNHIIISLLFAIAFISCNETGTSPRIRLLDDNWLFHYGDVANGEQPTLDDSMWRKLSLPHDWTIEDIPGTDSPFDSTVINGVASGFTRGGIGWYRKHFHIANAEEGKRFYVRFDGVYMNSDIWVNGRHVGNEFYGYSTFGYDITPYLKYGADNLLAVQVKSETVTSRWYSGSGIYRHVWLTATEPLYIDHYGTVITTPEVSGQVAKVAVSTTLINDTGEPVQPVVRLKILNSGNQVVGQSQQECNIIKGEKLIVNQELIVSNPNLWSVDTPHLYTLVSEVIQGGNIVDSTKETFGIRSILFDPEKGFFLNGEALKLKGGCIHHDNGPLGAMAFDRAEERKVELHKEAGFNALRMAHNPPSPALLDACDRLGILVIDEAFDVWRYGHFEEDYSKRFDELWRLDLERMIIRDRNHPSVIMWSIGNEIKQNDTAEMADLSRQLAEYTRSIDDTRPVTAGVNSVSELKDAYLATLDVAGYNYSPREYVSGHERHPEQLIYASESYASQAYDYWKDVEKYDWLIGDFIWTSFDYIGEASIGWYGYYLEQSFYPFYLAYCGDIDVCGIRRPQSYYRETLWSNTSMTYISITPPVPSFRLNPRKEDWSVWDWPDEIHSWNFDGCAGQDLNVWVYTACEESELFFNGESLGRRTNTTDAKNKLGWKVPYQEGVLEAKGYIKGQEVTTSQLKTAGEVANIRVTADRTMLSANGQDLSYITVELIDAEGNVNPLADHLVTFEVSGEGSLIAVANSNPMSTESFQKDYRKAWRGQCLAILKSEKKAGNIHLTVKATGLPDAHISIGVK
ncbi:DUF4982 domain-containing protein [Bacteroides sp. 51]|nr:DUF4982 domain-containing protein [Bacteroides sp. 51]